MARRVSRRVRAWLSLAAVAVVGVLLLQFTLRGAPPDEVTGETRDDPDRRWGMAKEPVAQLAGRAEAPSLSNGTGRKSETEKGAEQRGRSLLRGVVTARNGQPLFRALVYVLPKSIRGLRDPTLVPNVASDRSGKFALPVKTLAKQWVCAIAEGYLPTYLDGDVLDHSRSVNFALDPGGVVEVIAHDAHGDMARTTYVRVETARGQESAPIPAPGTVPDVVVLGNTGTKGRSLVRVGTTGAVVVRATCWGYYSVPASVRLERPTGVAKFTLRKSCGLLVRVVDASDGSPLSGSFGFEVHDAKTGKIVNGAAAISPYGECELRDRLPPGTYTVRVHMPGMKDWVRKNVVLPEPGKRVSLEARLEPNPAVGDILLSVPSLRRHESRPGEVVPAPTLIWRESGRNGRPWRLHGAPSSGDGKGSFRVDAFPEGAYDLLVYFPSLKRVGAVRDLVVLRGREAFADVALEAGVRVPLKDFLAPADRVTGLTVVAGDGQALPVVRMTTNGLSLFGPEETPSPMAILGPYPARRVTVSAKLAGEPSSKSHVVDER